MTPRVLLPLVALATGCTFQPGGAWMLVEEARVEAAFRPEAARDLGGSAFLTDLGYRVEPSTVRVELHQVALQELEGSAGGTFDPAAPPPGYGLCHDGHCHRDDGALVPYAEIEVELSAGRSALVDVAVLPVGAGFDLLAGESLLAPVLPSPDLPAAELSLLVLDVGRFELSAQVSGGPSGGELPEPVELLVDLPLADRVTAGLSLTIDRDQPEVVDVVVTWTPGATLLDGLDFGALGDEPVRLDDPESEAGRAIRERLLAHRPTLSIEEHEESP